MPSKWWYAFKKKSMKLSNLKKVEKLNLKSIKLIRGGKTLLKESSNEDSKYKDSFKHDQEYPNLI